jgi:hypothetical protein
MLKEKCQVRTDDVSSQINNPGEFRAEMIGQNSLISSPGFLCRILHKNPGHLLTQFWAKRDEALEEPTVPNKFINAHSILHFYIID